MILYNLQKLLTDNPDLTITMATIPDNRFIVHVIKEECIIAKGISITLDRAAEKAIMDYTEFRKPDPRQEKLGLV